MKFAHTFRPKFHSDLTRSRLGRKHRKSPFLAERQRGRSPKDFVGVMDVAIDLRSVGDGLLDSRLVRLEWIEKKEQRSAPQSDASKQPRQPPTSPLRLPRRRDTHAGVWLLKAREGADGALGFSGFVRPLGSRAAPIARIGTTICPMLPLKR